MDDTVTLVIPCAPEFVGVARLTILGVASRFGFSYDAIEDIRLAVAEACVGAIARSRALSDSPAAFWITLRARGNQESFTVEIEDTVPPDATARLPSAAEPAEEQENVELGSLLIELLMDEVEIIPSTPGTLIRLVKWQQAS